MAGLPLPENFDLHELLRDWRQDSHQFVQHDLPKIVFVALVSFLLIRLLSAITARLGTLKITDRYSEARARQVKTMAGVIGSVGNFAIFFVASLEILSQLGFNLGPLLASAGIVGLAIGFGAQTLVKDVINGFFILLENQYDIGDSVRAAGVKGNVEEMSLRRTVLRDDDGTVHTIPNSEIKLVSNMTSTAWPTVKWTICSSHEPAPAASSTSAANCGAGSNKLLNRTKFRPGPRDEFSWLKPGSKCRRSEVSLDS